MKSSKLSLVFLIIFFLAPCLNAYNQSIIVSADSLFRKKNYQEAFKLYHKAFQDSIPRDLQTFLKIIYVAENSGQYPYALYWLDKLYSIAPQPSTLQKITMIAEDYQLTGYDYDQYALIEELYLKYRGILPEIACLSSLFFTIIITLVASKKNRIPWIESVGVALWIALMLWLLNAFKVSDTVIITSEPTYLMQGPSSGSAVIKILSKGHKCKVISFKDIWLEIRIGNSTGFVRRTQVIEKGNETF